MKTLIDPCAFSTVRDYFESPDSGIDMIVAVQAGAKLEEVAAIMVASRDNDDQAKIVEFLDLLKDGKVKIVTPLFKQLNTFNQSTAIDLDTIPLYVRCNVIQLPPCYVIEITDQVWK